MIPEFVKRLLGFGIPQVVYSDRLGNARVLVSKRYELVGKPDYVVQSGDTLIPIEVKSGKTPLHPHEAHILQLAAYCLLVEENFQQQVEFGVIQYPQAAFKIGWERPLKLKLIQTLAAMQNALLTRTGAPADTPIKCVNCPHLSYCPSRQEPPLERGRLVGEPTSLLD